MLLIVRKRLEGIESGNWVLVIDNADNKLDVFSGIVCGNNGLQCDLPEGLSAYIPQGSKGIVAITTRDMEVAYHLADSNVISKERMDPKDVEAIFRNNYPRRQKSIENGDSDLQELLKELQYLPLAIKQAASYLEMTHLKTLPQYLGEFKTTRELLSRPHKNTWRPGSNTETALTTFHITFDQIQNQLPLAGSLLRYIACIDRQGIPNELLVDLVRQDNDENELEKDDDCAKLFDDALEKLLNFSILQIMATEERFYEIHTLVYLSIVRLLKSEPEKYSASISKVASVLAETPTSTSDMEKFGEPFSAIHSL